MLKTRVKRDVQVRSTFCLTRRAVPEVEVVRSGQDCDSAHQDCRTTSHLQKKQEKSIYVYVCVCFYTYIHI